MRVLLFITIVGLGVACSASPPTDAERARAIDAQVWSPYCPGRLLSDCATRQSGDLRDEIARRIARGETDAEVLAWVRDEFGEQAVARPEASGRGLVIWLVPAAIFAFGTVVVVRVLSRTQQEGTHADP